MEPQNINIINNDFRGYKQKRSIGNDLPFLLHTDNGAITFLIHFFNLVKIITIKKLIIIHFCQFSPKIRAENVYKQIATCH